MSSNFLQKLFRKKQSIIQIVENWCKRFPRFIKQNQRNFKDESLFNITNENDLHNFFYYSLQLYFNDVRKEELSPSIAGGGSRIDILLKQEKIAIEIKFMNKKVTSLNLGSQLLSDLKRYRSHPDCDTLIFFIYDPDYYISNPSGLENDINDNIGDFQVKVIISPQ